MELLAEGATMRMISLEKCKRRLATIWFIGAAILIVTFIMMSISGPFQHEPQQAWGWLLPSCIPTLSLVIGCYVAEAGQKTERDRQVDPFLFNIAAWISTFYLAILILTVISLPYAVGLDKSAEFLQKANLWVAPIQGLATAVLGAFFVRHSAKA